MPTIAVIAPGAVGTAIGARLAGRGVRVLTSLDGRGAPTSCCRSCRPPTRRRWPIGSAGRQVFAGYAALYRHLAAEAGADDIAALIRFAAAAAGR
jgi:hypothetical protein